MARTRAQAARAVARVPAVLKWDTTPEDTELVRQIVARAYRDLSVHALPAQRYTLEMDLVCVHRNVGALRLRELLEADRFNFGHDIYGIVNCINRETGTLDRCFVPRFTVPRSVRS